MRRILGKNVHRNKKDHFKMGLSAMPPLLNSTLALVSVPTIRCNLNPG